MTFAPFKLGLSAGPEVLCIPSPATPGEYFYVDEDGFVAEGAYVDFELPGVGSIKSNLGAAVPRAQAGRRSRSDRGAASRER